MQKENLRTRGFGGCYSHYCAGGFVLRRCRNSIGRYSTAPKCEFRSQFPLFPLDGVGSSVPSLQLHPVFGIDTERVPPNDAMSRFVGFGDKSWDNLKNFFQTQGFEFLFLSQGARRAAFGGSISPKNARFETQPPLSLQTTSFNSK